jgi:hypothetical protein
MRNETWGKNNKNGSSIYASENNVLSRDEGFGERKKKPETRGTKYILQRTEQ